MFQEGHHPPQKCCKRVAPALDMLQEGCPPSRYVARELPPTHKIFCKRVAYMLQEGRTPPQVHILQEGQPTP